MNRDGTYEKCPECGEDVTGWLCLPPVQIEYCRACTTFEQAMEDAKHRWEIGKIAASN